MSDYLIQIEVEDVKDITPVKFNEKEIADYINNKIEFYSKVEYTDQPITDPKGGFLLPIGDAKKNRAMLNKVVKALKDKRLDVVKRRTEPLNHFIEVIKKFESDLKAPIEMIDAKVKEAEAKIKEEKSTKILAIYGEHIGDIAEILTYKKVFNERWLNTTFKMKDIEKELIENINLVKSDLKVIESLKNEFEVQLKDVYLKNFILSDVFTEKTRLEELKLKNERLKKEREQKEAEKIIVDEKSGEASNKETGEVVEKSDIQETQHTCELKITTTIKLMNELKEFMQNKGINYEKITKKRK
jgi:hypothetical protein